MWVCIIKGVIFSWWIRVRIYVQNVQVLDLNRCRVQREGKHVEPCVLFSFDRMKSEKIFNRCCGMGWDLKPGKR